MIAAAAKKQTWMKEVVLIVDAMTLHKGTVGDPTSRQYVGHVDYGTAVPEAPDELATKALVFLVVGKTGHFKHPIVMYFKTNVQLLYMYSLYRLH